MLLDTSLYRIDLKMNLSIWGKGRDFLPLLPPHSHPLTVPEYHQVNPKTP